MPAARGVVLRGKVCELQRSRQAASQLNPKTLDGKARLPRGSSEMRFRHVKMAGLVGVALLCAGPSAAQTIVWLDWSSYPIPGSGTVISHPILGDVQVTTDFEPQATFPKSAGSLGSLSWDSFIYINYDASSTGTNSPISATMTFSFLNGPIDLSTTRIFFSANGLADNSSYLVSGSPTLLGAIGALDGPGTYTPMGSQLLIEGVEFNHDPDLLEIKANPITSISVVVSQVLGDGAGLTIGAAEVEVASVPALSARGFVLLAALLAGVGVFATRRTRAEAAV